MCGVAQEVTQEGDLEAYTKPWHVTFTSGMVRVLHQTPKPSGFLYILKCVLAHKHFYPCSLSPASDPS